MALPDIVARIEFNRTATGTITDDTLVRGFAAADTSQWTDVSAYLRSFSVQRGKSHELSRIEAGTASVLLDNRDRRFDPNHTAGPYYPNVEPMRRIQLLTSHGYSGVIRSAGPNAYWRLGDAVGQNTALDTTANANNGTRSGALAFGLTGAIASDPDTACGYSAGDPAAPNIVVPNSISLQPQRAITIEMWVYIHSAQGYGDQFWLSKDGSYKLVLAKSGVSYWLSAGVWTGGVLSQIAPGDLLVGPSHLPALDTWAHVAMTYDSATGLLLEYLDGTLCGSKAVAGLITVNTNLLALFSSWPAGDFGSAATLDEVAVYDRALSATEIGDHYDAGIGGLVPVFTGYIESWPQAYPALGKDAIVQIKATDAFRVLNLAKVSGSYGSQTSGVRIGAILDAIAWPATERLIDTGRTTLQASTLSDVTALSHLLLVAESENGLFLIDPYGRMLFQDRWHRYQQQRHEQATFGDAGGSELPYQDIVIEYDEQEIYNQVTVTREGGTAQTVNDVPSQDKYFARNLSRTGQLMATDAEALSSAHFLAGGYRLPYQRVRQLGLSLGAATDDTRWPLAIGLTIGDVVRVKRRPLGVGTAIDQLSVIEGVEHRATAVPRRWETRWRLSSADQTTVWIVGDAVYGRIGITTRPGY